MICKWLKSIFSRPKIKTVDDLVKYCDTPAKLDRWMFNNIKYTSDIVSHNLKDYWQSPEETLYLRKGDCEDYSILSDEVLSRLGYNPYLLCVYTPDKGHAVCAYNHKGSWYHISNWGIKYCRGAETPNDICDYVYKEWTKFRTYKYDNGKINIIETGYNK